MNTAPYILIVDDNPENIKVLGSILSRKNYRLIVTQNGIQALKSVEVILPDLILLDIMMPEMDGYQVCEELKKHERTRDIPIIFLTAAIDQEHELKGLKLGAVDYIHKPFSIPLVEARVSTHLELVQNKKTLLEKNAALEEMAKLRDEIDKITQHDLKVPLNAIIGFPQILLMDANLTDEQRELLNHVIKAGYEMLGMINMSLDLFKMETGRYRYEPQQFDMTLLLQAVIKDLETLIHSHSIETLVFIEGKTVTEQGFIIEAEKILCHSLFTNLLKNAIEVSPRGSTIKINLQHLGEEDLITVTNPGMIPENIRAHFFDKYITSDKQQGSSLGAYSAKLMTEVQHGKIAMSSDELETTVSVFLPAKSNVELQET